MVIGRGHRPYVRNVGTICFNAFNDILFSFLHLIDVAATIGTFSDITSDARAQLRTREWVA